MASAIFSCATCGVNQQVKGSAFRLMLKWGAFLQRHKGHVVGQSATTPDPGPRRGEHAHQPRV